MPNRLLCKPKADDLLKNTCTNTRISCAGSYFKPILLQVASALVKSKKHSEITVGFKLSTSSVTQLNFC